jgi:hypothetical protein
MICSESHSQEMLMVTVTDLVLAQALFGRPQGSTADGLGWVDQNGFQNPIPSRAAATASNAMRGVALANALDRYPADTYGSTPAMEASSAGVDWRPNARWQDLPGRDVSYGGEVSPMITGLQRVQRNEHGASPRTESPVMTAASNWLNQWGQREYDLYDPPPVPPLPFRRQYRSDAPPPADSARRLTHDPEGRPLGARYIVGLTEVDGLNVGLRPEQMADVTRRLMGRDPTRLPGWRLPPRTLGDTRYDTQTFEPAEVRIRSDLRPDLRRKVEAHELSHVIELIAKFIPVEPHRAQLRSIYNTLNNPSRTRDGLDAAPGSVFVPLQRNRAYSGWSGDRELMAEAIRAYLVDPNYIKTVAPELAGAIRDAANSNPILAPVIQFNNLRLPTHAGLPPSAGQPRTGAT